jgi:hypothetical protein
MPAPRGLCDVQGEVAHPLDVARAVDRRDHDAQIGRHRRLQGEKPERLLLGCDPQVVDPDVVRDHLLGQLQVRIEEGTRRVLHRQGGLAAHVGERVREPGELFLVQVAHTSSVVVSTGRIGSGG